MRVYYINSGVETEIAEVKDYTNGFNIAFSAAKRLNLDIKYWRGYRENDSMMLDFGDKTKFFRIGE